MQCPECEGRRKNLIKSLRTALLFYGIVFLLYVVKIMVHNNLIDAIKIVSNDILEVNNLLLVGNFCAGVLLFEASYMGMFSNAINYWKNEPTDETIEKDAKM